MSDNSLWQGRVDSEDGQAGWRWHQKINQHQFDTSIALHGFNCDLGVQANKGRIGAAKGPDAIRAGLANLAWHGDFDVLDTGNTDACESLTESQQRYAQTITQLLDQHAFVVGLGGGHEIALGSYLGLAQQRMDKIVGIINIDAHLDLRRCAPNASSGTPFRQIHQWCQTQNKPFHYACLGVAKTANTPALFDYAKESGTLILQDYQCTMPNAQQLLSPMLQQIDTLYLTVCLDAFHQSVAPGVSAPSAVGIEPHWVLNLIDWLHQAKSVYHFDWTLMDVAEMNPIYDKDQRTAKLAARIIAHSVAQL